MKRFGGKLVEARSSLKPFKKSKSVSRISWPLNSFINSLMLTGMNKIELEIN